MDILKVSDIYKNYVIDLRRFFHQIPEPGFNEFKTTDKIIEELKKYGIDYKRCSKTGVIAQINGKKNGKTIALRADIDALSVNEENDIPYKSTNPGFMHACGHDAHNAMLLTSARILKEHENELNGKVRFMFQPAEEGSKYGQGAVYMINEGVLEGVDSAFGMHVMPDLECGKIAAMSGPIMASVAEFEITVIGNSGHGAAPHYCVDAVAVASAIVMNLQTVVSREINPIEPAVVSVGTINGGTRFNVIAGEVKLTGTVRTFSSELCEKIPNIVERIINSTAASYRAKASLVYKTIIKPTINNETCIDIAKATIGKLYGNTGLAVIEKQMGGEDFSEYANLIPSAFCFLGVGNIQKNTVYPIHSSKFTMDEDALIIGASVYAQYAIDFLNKIE